MKHRQGCCRRSSAELWRLATFDKKQIIISEHLGMSYVYIHARMGTLLKTGIGITSITYCGGGGYVHPCVVLWWAKFEHSRVIPRRRREEEEEGDAAAAVVCCCRMWTFAITLVHAMGTYARYWTYVHTYICMCVRTHAHTRAHAFPKNWNGHH